MSGRSQAGLLPHVDPMPSLGLDMRSSRRMYALVLISVDRGSLAGNHGNVDATVVDRDRIDVKDDPRLVSPPWLRGPLYRCAESVTVLGFVPHARVEVEVDGQVVVDAQVGFPEPVGATLVLPFALSTGQAVRVRQTVGATSDWSPSLVVRDHTVDYPAGPPRPQIEPTPLFRCGSRTGVDNLLGGGNVWVVADGGEVGRVDACTSPKQGVNIEPTFRLGQTVQAHFELCGDRSPASVAHAVQPGPTPLPVPRFDPSYEGSEQLRITGVVNGARVSVTRGGNPLGTFRCWGGALLVTVDPPAQHGELFQATQRLCRTDPSSGQGETEVEPCSSLPAPTIGALQAGDTRVTILHAVPGATIRVYRNLSQVGLGSAPIVNLTEAVGYGDVVHVVQALQGCVSQRAFEVIAACVDPPTIGNPAALDLFPVAFGDYAKGPVRGSVYYPADRDGRDQPFNARLAATGRSPIVVMAHGNHSPADPSYRGYNYFQRRLARMGIVAVSVDCNALNGGASGVGNIEDRADLIIDSIRHFQSLDSMAGSVFHRHIDFHRLGLMGHSRGGDAIVTIPTVLGNVGVTIQAGLALAPTNFRYWDGLSTIAPAGYSFMTILPAADGDVTDNNGAQFYDQAEPGPFKSQVYAYNTNHNFFNREWLDDDGVTPVLDRSAHENILTSYGCAFFRAALLGHTTYRYLDGTRKSTGAPTVGVYLSYMKARQTTIDHHDDGNGIPINTLGLPTSQAAGMSADEYPFDRSGNAFNSSFFGMTVGMVMQPKEAGAIFRTETGGLNLSNREIWLRAAEVADGPAQGGQIPFEVGLEDDTGNIGWVPAEAVGGLPGPFIRSRTKTMLSTLRFKPQCARPERRALNLRRIVAILFRYRQGDPRALAIDDLQVVTPGGT